MNSTFSQIFNADYLFTLIRVMTPILFASLACMMFYKGGVDAIATEGMMLMSALAGVLGAHYSQSVWAGILSGMLFGSLISMLYVYMTNRMLANDILAGISINTFASGITVFLLYLLAGEKGSSQNLPSPTVPAVQIPLIKDIPLLGSILSGHSLLTYLGLAMVVFTYFFLYKTPIGLRIRAVGKNPGAAASVGINVVRTRYLSASIAGALAGLGGVFMSMSYISNFTRDMVAGRGFIGMAAEGMGRGTPLGVLLASLLFGAVDSLAIRLQGLNLPARLVQAIPYVITIIVITIYSYLDLKKKARRRTSKAPSAGNTDPETVNQDPTEKGAIPAMNKTEFFKGKTAREIAIATIKESEPRLQTEEEAHWTENYVDLGSIEVDHFRRRWFSEVPGSMAPDHVVIGAIQAQENKGYDVSKAEKLIVPAQEAYEKGDHPTLIKHIALIFKLLSEAPKNESDPYWNYPQYESFEQYLESVSFPEAKPIDFSKDGMITRLHAAWSSQIAGGALGTIIEGYTTDQIRKKFGEVTTYLRNPSTHNDDNLFELAFIDAVRKKGKDVTADDIALEWIANITYAWSAEEVALANLKRGIFPPKSATLNNPWNEWIGAQMRGAICGLVAPGDPKEAARLAWMDGSISHVNNGILGEVFNALLTSIAWTDSDVRSILTKSIDLIPSDSEYHSVIRFAYDQCLIHDSWEDAWRVCEEKYRRYNWIHSYPNAAAEVIALYYAREDFDECMHIIAMCGQDVDCNAGMIGTVYGVIHGFAGIADSWLEPFHDGFESLYRGYEKTTLKQIAEATYEAYARLNQK